MVTSYQQFDLFGKKTMEKVVIEPPFHFVYQMPNEACFYYMIKGNTELFTPLEKVEIETQEGIVLQCGNYICEVLENNVSDYCEAIAVHLRPDILEIIYDKEFPDFLVKMEKIKPINYEKHYSNSLLKNYIDSLQFYFAHPALMSNELLKLKLRELLLLLAKTDKVEALVTLLSGLFTPNIIDFKEVIEANLYNNLALEQLAQLTNLSLSSFKRTFTKHYRSSPAKYIRLKKLEKAAKLLKATAMRVSDIAFECGFVDTAHFSKCFQKEYQLSPSAYRLN